MKKLIYIQEKFLDPSLCVPFIELAKRNNKEMPYGDEDRGGDTFLTTVTHSNPNQSLAKGLDVPEPDGNYGAIYLGGEVDPTTIEVDDEIYDVKNLLEKEISNFISTEIEWVPINKINLNEEEKIKMNKFLEILEEDDDVQNVFTNAN